MFGRVLITTCMFEVCDRYWTGFGRNYCGLFPDSSGDTSTTQVFQPNTVQLQSNTIQHSPTPVQPVHMDMLMTIIEFTDEYDYWIPDTGVPMRNDDVLDISLHRPAHLESPAHLGIGTSSFTIYDFMEIRKSGDA